MSDHITAECHPKWTPDCGGKWDYDCEIVALSCRYWPRGGGFLVLDSSTGTFQDNDSRPYIKPSAEASICIGDLAVGPYETLASAKFEGETEADVKAQVEVWAREMIALVFASVRRTFQAHGGHDA